MGYSKGVSDYFQQYLLAFKQVLALRVAWQHGLPLGESFKILLYFCIDRNISWFYHGHNKEGEATLH